VSELVAAIFMDGLETCNKLFIFVVFTAKHVRAYSRGIATDVVCPSVTLADDHTH